MTRSPRWRGACTLTLLAASSSLSVAFAQAPPRPEAYSVQGVQLGRGGDSATLLLRDGRIEAVLEADASVPHGTRVINGAGLTALPAFVDAYSRAGCATPEPVKDQDAPVDVVSDVRVDMRLANRKGIQPSFRAVDVLALSEGDVKAWREAGFGALLSSPSGQLLAGTSTLATVRDAAMRDVVVRPDVYAHAAFRAGGSGYPSTLMGYIAQLRQFFLDVRHHEELQRRYAQGRPGIRPPHDDELEAGRAILSGDVRLLCEAQTARDVERWIKLSEEFGFRPAISGGRDAWKVADKLAVLDVPVVLTLDWGEEAKDPEDKKEKNKKLDEWEYREPEAVRAERRRLWEERRDCAIRLSEAGVRFAFGTGDAKPKDLMKNVRALIEAGLDADVALGALTTGGAAVVGAERRLGEIAPGHDATLVLWDGDPLTDKKAKPAWAFVDGFAHEFERKEEKGAGGGDGPDEGVDVTGDWTVALQGEGESPSEATVTLEMEEDGAVTGTYSTTIPGGPAMEADVEGWVDGTKLTLSGSMELGDQEITFELTGEIEGDTIEGESKVNLPWAEEPTTRLFEATRDPESGDSEKGGVQ